MRPGWLPLGEMADPQTRRPTDGLPAGHRERQDRHSLVKHGLEQQSHVPP